MIAQMIKLWQIVVLPSSESIAAFERRKSRSKSLKRWKNFQKGLNDQSRAAMSSITAYKVDKTVPV